MKPERFYELLENPAQINREDISEIEQLVQEYPWFQAARVLLLKSELMQGSFRFSRHLQQMAVSTGDRQHLYEWLHLEPQKTISISNQPLNESEKFPDNLQQVSTAELRKQENRKLRKQEIEKVLDNRDLLYFDFDYVPEAQETMQQDMRKKTSQKKYDLQNEIDQSGDELTDDTKKWLAGNIKKARQKAGKSETDKHKQDEIIERFISFSDKQKKQPPPPTGKSDDKSAQPEDIEEESTTENADFMTETMAKIYAKQGLYEKAIATYEKLSLKYPEKNTYFASRIKELRNNINNQ